MKGGIPFMHLFIMFDIPTETAEHRKKYTKFRKSLMDNGFTMIQYSVYSRCYRGLDGVEKGLDRVKSYLPPEGNVRALTLTDKQFGAMKLLLGNKKQQEDLVYQQLLLF